jgi:hypothetical protein
MEISTSLLRYILNAWSRHPGYLLPKTPSMLSVDPRPPNLRTQMGVKKKNQFQGKVELIQDLVRACLVAVVSGLADATRKKLRNFDRTMLNRLQRWCKRNCCHD